MTTTAECVQTWRTRHARAGPDWAARYWASAWAPHRDVLLHACDDLVPTPDAALEIGANAGPNLRRMARRWPRAQLIALDVNAEALTFLRGAARSEGWGPRLTTHAGDARGVLPALPTAAADLVFSVYALAYVAPDDVCAVLDQARRLASRRVVLMEPMAEGPSRWLGETLPHVTPAGWAHDYPARIRRLGGAPTSEPFAGPDGLTAVVTWEVAAA